MTEEVKTEQVEQQFLIQRIYTKDLSLENPMGPEAFTITDQPTINQDLASEINKINDELYETTLKLTITASLDEKTIFLVEIQQAGLFAIKGIEGDNLSRVLNTVCPQILFPYARETIDSALTKATFPPLMLPPINFDALYAQALEEQKNKAH
ncbi:export cytoplasm chaperone protein [gamma proteobacterium IMCC1989]|nr:export cytoplasm chaperone protein [gamma proteobacterium IMCC1989]